MRPALALCALLSALALQAVPALADDRSALAEAVFDEGVRLLREGRVDEACAALTKAIELSGGEALGGILLLAECHEKAGRTATAWSTYRRALALAKQRGQEKREQAAAEAIARLEPALPRLVLRVAPALAAQPSLRITRAGTELPREAWGIPAPVDPGKVEVIAELPGAPPHRLEVQAEAARTAEVQVDPWPAADEALRAKPEEPAAPAGPAKPAPASGGAEAAAGAGPDRGGGRGLGALGAAGLVAGGLGLVGIGAGVVVGLGAKSSYDDAIADPAHSCQGGQCNALGKEAVDAARGQGTTATIVFAAGAALLAGGATLVIVDLAGSPREPGSASTRAPRLAVGALPAGLTLKGRF